MAQKKYTAESAAILQALQLIEQGKVQRTRQENSSQNYKVLTPEDSRIPEKMFSEALYNHIRSCDPEKYPAFIEVEGEKVFVKLWRNKENKEPDTI